jgi:hypothetical protein
VWHRGSSSCRLHMAAGEIASQLLQCVMSGAWRCAHPTLCRPYLSSTGYVGIKFVASTVCSKLTNTEYVLQPRFEFQGLLGACLCTAMCAPPLVQSHYPSFFNQCIKFVQGH